MRSISLRYIIAAALVAACFTAGCVDYIPGHKYQRGWYSWGFINRSSEFIKEVKIEYNSAGEDVWVGPLSLLPRQSGTDDTAVHPVPETVNMHWRTPDGQQHEQEMPIRSAIAKSTGVSDPKNFTDGNVWFVYDGKQWTVIPLTAKEERRRIVQENKSWPLEVVY